MIGTSVTSHPTLEKHGSIIFLTHTRDVAAKEHHLNSTLIVFLKLKASSSPITSISFGPDPPPADLFQERSCGSPLLPYADDRRHYQLRRGGRAVACAEPLLHPDAPRSGGFLHV
ncbi:hypothetical protein OSB04_030062 [Centaurea solstitialis]|uniref:Uncharacterized protein n=1 Tax=Centaurea solstitialis TaxID=347529 RepID=A0AA38S653_9ASTR|nr:hypothetical protein OSB04_030062 [Centaurea solstitialis]